ncbi:YciI family protein [Amycolatopsis sp. GM8]|uniref:YciI family protein n=1 Tax=Amycolatopsis sp. GM8 TaxID=2896530 RepID=UPI001F33E43C|nr:YciI family protein [Amycolatopsis sp. GM8]
MYVVLLTYKAPIEEVDYLLPDHTQWLDRHFKAGEFLAAGRQLPRDGGVIIARHMSRAKLDAILCMDPLFAEHLATHQVIQFSPTRTAPELRLLNELLPQSA